MKVRVLYFASAREIASASAENLTVSDGSTLGDLARVIRERHPAFGKLGSSVKFSVNLDVVGLGTVLTEGDEIGVLPPVAGG